MGARMDGIGFGTSGAGPASASLLAGGLWYPVAAAGPTTLLFDSPIFQGVPVQPEAAIQPGRWPLVLVSHGIGGHWRSLSWLGAGLAQQGALVVGVNRPGSTFSDYDMRRSLDHGTRVNDLKATLDALLADTAIGPHIDPQRIYVAGFSFGAFHGWIARAGIDLTQLNASIRNRSYRDPRVKAVAAVDPGLHQGLSAAHASDVVDKVRLIGLGQGADRLPDTDFSAPGTTLTSILPKARTEVMSPAFHFSALSVCKPAGAKLLAEDNDDPVCSDPPGTDRHALHERITRLIGRHFGLVL